MESSCSFRITRTAEDLAQTVTAISQRLVQIEQRLELLEQKSIQPKDIQTEEEMVMLDGVDELLQQCKGLLNESSNHSSQSDQLWLEEKNETHSSEDIAA